MTRTNDAVQPVLLEEIQRYIGDQIEESLHLEYKGGEALQRTDQKKKEIAKDVSAMANASGGRIIYGVREYEEKDKQHLPKIISPIDRTAYSKEWLEQIIVSTISPRIDGVVIHSLPADEKNGVVYVVDIPQSHTAHQCLLDQRYYKRHNFQSMPMLDYEIRDVMNRQKHPVIVLEYEITTETFEVGSPFPIAVPWAEPRERQYRTVNELVIVPRNIGSVYAKYVEYFVDIPDCMLEDRERENLTQLRDGRYRFRGDNTYRDVVGVEPSFPGMKPIMKYGSSRFDPILPQSRGVKSTVRLKQIRGQDDDCIEWTVHADNASANNGSIRVSDIDVRTIQEPN